jgi:PAS domain S-box-containing protein
MRMTLRRTVLLGIGLALIALILVLFYTLENTLMRQFETEEIQNELDVVERGLISLNIEYDAVENTSRDWAKWDDSYQFVLDGNPEYVDSNLGGSTLPDLEIHLMAFLDLQGNIIFIRILNPDSGEVVPVPAALSNRLVAGDALIQNAESRSPKRGILVMPDGPLLVVSHPILKTEGMGPAAGTLIIGRYMNSQNLQRLGSLFQLSFLLYPYNSNELPPDVLAAKPGLQNPGDTLTVPMDDATAAGYTLIGDYYGDPGYILRMDISRTQFRNRQATTNYLTIYLIMSAVIFSVMVLILFEGLVLSRLARLNKEVNRIGQSGDISQRVTVQYKDEISNLSRNINQSLANLEQAQRQRQESEQRFRTLVESMDDVVFTLDLAENITEVFGRGALSGEMIQMIRREANPQVEDQATRLLHHLAFVQAASGSAQVYEWEGTLDGQHFFIQTSLSPMRDEHGAVFGVVSVGRNITRLKLLEQDLQERLRDLSALYAASRIFLSRLDLQDTFNATAELAVDTLGCDIAWVGRVSEHGAQLKPVASKGTPLENLPSISLADAAACHETELIRRTMPGRKMRTSLEPPLPTTLPWLAGNLPDSCVVAAIPLLVEEETQGLLVIYRFDGGGFHPQGIQLLQSFANLASFAVQNANLYEQVRSGRERMQELSYQLVEIQETERQRLAQELHDEIGQLLTGLKMLIQAAANDPVEAAVGRLQQANELAEQLIARVRQMSLDLRPAMLDDLGLIPALTWLFERYSKQTGVQIGFQHSNLEGKRFPAQVETTAYRIIQEALTNIARHAQVSQARVRVWVCRWKMKGRVLNPKKRWKAVPRAG